MTWAVGTFDSGDGAFPGVVVDEAHVHDVTAVAPTVRALFEHWDEALPRLEQIAAQGGGIGLEGVHVLAPIEPRQVLQAGANYYKHVLDIIVAERRAQGIDEEAARAEGTRIMDERVATGEPYIFLGAVGAICGPYDNVILPPRGEQHDWELELCAVLGSRGEIAGFTIANDLTTRDLVYRHDLKVIGTDWMRSKNAPTFLPLGPWIVPAHLVDPTDLQLTLRLNGAPMQDESTSDMIFDVDKLHAYTAERVRLLAGDLLLTGSPAGNGIHWGRFLQAGDVIEAAITGLGTQRNHCVAGG